MQYYQLGETVSTDIFEFTLDEAKMTIALNSIYDKNYFTPKEYDAQQDTNNPFVAPKGHTYAAFTYTVKNLDRASNEFHNGYFISAEYNRESYSNLHEGAYFLYQDSQYLDENGRLQTDKANEWHSKPANNFHLGVGETETRRAYVDMAVDVDNLNDEFKLIVQIPNSDGAITKFKYLVNEEDRLSQQVGSETLKAAIITNEGETVSMTAEELIADYDSNEARFNKQYQYAKIEFTGTIDYIKVDTDVIVESGKVSSGQQKIVFKEGWCLVIGESNTKYDLADFDTGDVIRVTTSIVGAPFDTEFLQTVSDNKRVIWLVGNDNIHHEQHSNIETVIVNHI